MRSALIFSVVVLAGCAFARVPPLTDAASHVRPITAEQGLDCQYIKNVDYTAKMAGMGKSFDLVHEAGENGLKNAVAAAAGNAYVATRMDADAMWGQINYAGQAFTCPDRIFAPP